jgi:hypothetical protein
LYPKQRMHGSGNDETGCDACTVGACSDCLPLAGARNSRIARQ